MFERTWTETVCVPAGTLSMGSRLEEVDACVRAWEDRLVDPSYGPLFRDWIMKEYPRHDVTVGAFAASRFPVTNAEYRRFLESDGTRERPESLAAELPEDHPVWGVSLEDAAAYARWRSDRDGRSWRLPTESEWEWMAAGPEHLPYPWGHRFEAARCNTVERGLGTTTPVGGHPEGASWCGAMDLAGNVEEWTGSRYAPYPGGMFIEDDLSRLVGRDYPIVRGGCFALGGDLARTTRRHGPHPGPRFRFIGFRIAEGVPSGAQA